MWSKSIGADVHDPIQPRSELGPGLYVLDPFSLDLALKYRVYCCTMKTFTRGQLARLAQIGTEAIRFYEREGLLPAVVRSNNGYRRYPEDTIQRLNFIQRAKRLGFNLKETKELLSLHDNPQASRADVKALTESKLTEIELRLEDLQRMRDVLSHLAAQCSGRGPIKDCPIIQALDDKGKAVTTDKSGLA